MLGHSTFVLIMVVWISYLIVMSVIACVGGASISNPSSSYLNQESSGKSHTIPDLAMSLWTEVHDSVSMAWHKVKIATGMQESNKEAQNSINPKSNAAQGAKTIPTFQLVEDKGAKNQSNPLLAASTITDETKNCDCEESTCWTWRSLKIVGIAVGAGFIFSLFSPVLFYFILLNIGYLFYGITFLFMAATCKARKGRQIGEKLCTACQDIAASSLQNMFSPFPIFLTWVGSGCLVGWLVWPFY